MVLIHIRLDFKHKGGKIRVRRFNQPAVCFSWQRRRRHLQEMLKEGLHAEVCQSRTEKNGRQSAAAYAFLVEFRCRAVKEFYFPLQLLFLFCCHDIQQMRIVYADLLFDAFLRTLQSVTEGKNLSRIAVINSPEVFPGTDRPVDRTGRNAKFLFNLIYQVKSVPGVPVELINESENRNVPHRADLKQFAGLGFHALAAVDDHDGRICRHQGTIGVL